MALEVDITKRLDGFFMHMQFRAEQEIFAILGASGSAVLPLDPVLEKLLTVERITENRPCPVCGRAFLPDGRQRYCSPTCARAARRQKQRGYMRKYRGRP